MARINLLGGTYLARSLIADAQRCLNLYPEKNPQDAAAPFTNQLTPGLLFKRAPLAAGVGRGMYTATNGSLFYVCGTAVYFIDQNFGITQLGNLLAPLTTPVAMQDNGNVLVIVDGTNQGYAINLQAGIAGRPLAGQLTDSGDVTATNASATATIGGSSFISGDVVAIFFTNPGVSDFPLSVSYTVPNGANASIIATALASEINSSSVLANDNVTASVAGAVITINQLGTIGNSTILTSSVTGTGNETVTFSGGGHLSGGTGSVATSGQYSNIPLTGGSGAGATGSFEIAGGTIISFSLDDAGLGFVVGDVLSTNAGGLSGVTFTLTGVGAVVNAFAIINDPNFLGSVGIGYVDTFLGFDQPGTRNFFTSLSNVTFQELTGTPGQLSEGMIIDAGSGGANAVYNNVPLTGGSGDGATANITVAGGIVTKVVLLPTGLGYNAGDDLGAATAGVPTDFQYSIVSVNPPAFDPTYIVGKTGYPDLLATIVAVHREWWLMGAFQSAEVWYDAGGANFPFAIMPGVFLEHGCQAPYSVQTHDLSVFWLGIDSAGQGTIFQGVGYTARRISTYAIEKILSGFLAAGNIISDAIGMCYKQQDHVFYVLTFPTANATLVYDVTEGLWHERSWTDPNDGGQNRIRANCMAFAYGLNICGDWQNGNIYVLDLATYNDFGGPIVRRRGFPHLLNDGKLHTIDRLALDMDCGNGDAANIQAQQLVTVEISLDRGHTFTKLPPQSMGAQGEYLIQMIWHRVSGLGRDIVIRVSWSGSAFTAISGAWIDTTASEK